MSKRQLHDAFFKHVFGRPELAADLIRHRLPAEAVDAIDLDRLEVWPTEFIDDTLRGRRADLVFRAPMRHAGEPETLFHVLMEHRSTPERLLPLRLLGYGMQLLTGHVERHAAEYGRPPRMLPLLVPLVVYQGPGPWHGPREMSALFPMPPALAAAVGPYLPQLRLLIDDLSDGGPPANPLRYPLSEAALLTMRYARNEADPDGFKAAFRALIDAARDDPHKVSVVEASARYLYDVSDRLGVGDIVEMAQTLADPEARETIMTLTEKLKAMGREEGVQQGMQQGIQQGMRRSRVEVLVNLIQLKFGAPDPATTARIERADIEHLDRWIARILTAESLDALLADAP